MAQTPPNLLYIVVVDDEDRPYSSRFAFSASSASFSSSASASASSRYTRSSLQNTLQLMGCKARHAFKISQRVFEVMRNEFHATACHLTERETSKSNTHGGLFDKADSVDTDDCLDDHEDALTLESSQRNNSIQFDLYKRLTTVFVCRENFLNVVRQALSQYKYVGPKQSKDLTLACRIRERKESFTVLLCGTSGCGKSTLSSLLGSRLGVTTVVSTDSIRHMMRSFVDEKKNPLLWSSTYHAGEYLDPVAVAKAKRKAKILARVSHSSDIAKPENDESKLIGERQMAIEGFKAQSEMVIESLDRLITSWEEKRESVVVEGVHLSLNFVMGLMKKHPSIIPFMVYISNEDKHMERFAVRAQYMTLDPSKNKYVKYIRNIRAIQEYLCNRADKHLVPKVNNTNVDKSVAAIHATVFGCLRRRGKGEHLYDPTTNTVPLINGEYLNQRASNSMTSKGMFQLIQRQGSSRNLMALLNTDGSVAKAWPVDSVQDNENSVLDYENKKNVSSPFLYGPLQIGKAEPVNLHFGKLGISAWPSETACSSHAGSIDESRADGTDSGSKCYSSSSSSLCSASKEHKNHSSVSGSEQDHDDHHDADEDSSEIDDKELHDDMGGSVDEESDKSDEEYEDFIKHDEKENGYLSDNDEPCIEQKLIVESATTTTTAEAAGENESQKILEKYQHKMYDSEGLLQESHSFYYSPVNSDRSTRRGGPGRTRRRSLSESSVAGNHKQKQFVF